MKKLLLILTLVCCATTFIVAQSPKSKFLSHEEYCKKQKEFITKHAKLTPEEAENFFPLFFELQKKKWEINSNVRKQARKKEGSSEPTAEEYNRLVNEIADAKIEIAKLEKSYIEKYLKIIPASKILGVQRAEDRFQREMIKNMARGQRKKENN